ncbi:nucleoside triphosphate pyrophosphohydrolase [Rossellomorea vietnamensis]|uniref:Nucleoside triphosphate pyrophosphohydrolase n=1 Tax=Rossellomorea vietnamensis TaxID=218284 RepID=A0A5D4K6E0_9BACI|nr:nucleoside triphosphate pyrophosphohydrolase [Rossellomorea vietnamensis]TYR72596.1 nucleoside triphosphate pyrophosphohydrolase [Rossellomorea vietnamensis]
MPVYNKLVRNRIPEIIESNGKRFSTRILSDEEYITELENKSFEELEEYRDAETRDVALEELADLMEIVHAFANSHGSTLEEVEEIRRMKAEKRGAFDKKIFLIDVED